MSCESWDSNAPYDVVPFPTADNHMNPIALYLGEHTERYLTHPYASPLFGDFKGLPPLLVQAGDCEVLRDEITLLAHKATLAGVQVMHELYEDAVSRVSQSSDVFSNAIADLSYRFTFFRLIHFLNLQSDHSSRCEVSSAFCYRSIRAVRRNFWQLSLRWAWKEK